MVEVDLHLHTTFSDGRLTPTELVRLCNQRGLKVIAISDHDSTEGLPEALEAVRSAPELTVIPAIELSTDAADAEIHLLGYFVKFEDVELQRMLRQLREGRQDRALRMVEQLNEMGIRVSWDRVQELSAGGAVGRPHIAQAMVEGGYVQYPREAFERYIGRNGVAYAERVKLTPQEAVRILVDNGALPVMAHPSYVFPESDIGEGGCLGAILKELKGLGMVGLEVYYSDYTPEQVQRLSALADEFGLVPCGGSDYHASGNPGEPEPGMVGPPMETVEALRALKRRITAT